MALFSSPEENTYLSDPDVTLMLEFQKGGKASFEKLMTKYYKPLLNFINRFVGNVCTAEDLTQDVFIKVYKNAATYRPAAKFQTWLYQIARNASLNELRKHKRQTVSIDETFESEDGESTRQIADAKAVNPADAMTQNETADLIKEAIHSLPENQKTAVLLRRYENLSYEDIAKTMHYSLAAVKSLLSRAKENLKEKLKHLQG